MFCLISDAGQMVFDPLYTGLREEETGRQPSTYASRTKNETLEVLRFFINAIDKIAFSWYEFHIQKIGGGNYESF